MTNQNAGTSKKGSSDIQYSGGYFARNSLPWNKRDLKGVAIISLYTIATHFVLPILRGEIQIKDLMLKGTVRERIRIRVSLVPP